MSTLTYLYGKGISSTPPLPFHNPCIDNPLLMNQRVRMISYVFTGYVMDWLLYGGALISALLKWPRLSRGLPISALMVNGCVLAMIAVASQQAPVFEIFGGLMAVIFVLGLLGAFWHPIEEGRENVRTWVWIEVFILLGITLCFSKTIPPHMYRHTHISVALFHAFRCLALSSAFFSAAHFIRFRQKQGQKGSPLYLKQGRNFLLLSALCFLCGEYAGIIWCQNGWGDFWHWSPSFFQSTVIILCLMFAFHIPGKGRNADHLGSVMAVMVPWVMLTVKVVKGLL